MKTAETKIDNIKWKSYTTQATLKPLIVLRLINYEVIPG
jgi:hypothetical protein